jgi:hypothetical protein
MALGPLDRSRAGYFLPRRGYGTSALSLGPHLELFSYFLQRVARKQKNLLFSTMTPIPHERSTMSRSAARSISGQTAPRFLLSIDAWAALAATTVLLLIIVGTLHL